jgi:HPt (histidine-containing phosphotransfer) domain-containing protein
VDISVLQGLVGDDVDVLRDFLTEYLACAQEEAAALRAAVAACDASRVNAIAHRLKSSSRSVGAVALGEVCAALEHAGAAHPISALGQDLIRFEKELAAVEADIGGQLTRPLSSQVHEAG